MAVISTNAVINAIRLAEQGSAPATPASGYWLVYAKSDGLYVKDDAGTETGPFGTGGGGGTVTRFLTLVRTDELSVGAGVNRLYILDNCTITNVAAWVSVAPTGASVILDVILNGTTIFTTTGNRPTITATNFTDLTSTPDVTSLSAGDYLTLDVDAIGSTIPGSHATVVVEVTVP